MLKIFVETDPEDPIFEGFRRTKHFYTNLSGEFVAEILKRLPMVDTVYFDSWEHVTRESPLMKRLESEVVTAGKRLSWGKGLISVEDCYELPIIVPLVTAVA